nr:hypothetical protein [Tanacetum cinerariifolium]
DPKIAGDCRYSLLTGITETITLDICTCLLLLLTSLLDSDMDRYASRSIARIATGSALTGTHGVMDFNDLHQHANTQNMYNVRAIMLICLSIEEQRLWQKAITIRNIIIVNEKQLFEHKRILWIIYQPTC